MTKIALSAWMFSFFTVQGHAQFQRQYGTALDEAFSKVIQSGTNYYVLGSGETTDGQLPRATVTRLNNQGQLQWTLSLNTASVWTDAVLTPSGSLLLVGYTLPFDASNKSLIGLVTAAGAFTFVRSYDTGGQETFTRIVRNPTPQSASFPYYILGTQLDPSGGAANWDDAVLLNANENGGFNWKKLYTGPLFFTGTTSVRDLEALPNGDLLIALNFETQGVVMRTNNIGEPFAGVTPEFPFAFTDVAQASNGNFYAVGTNFQNGQAHLMKLDADLVVPWDATISGLESVSQVSQTPDGGIYVTGINPAPPLLFQTAVYRLTDNVDGPVLAWVKYLDDGEVAYEGGTTSLLPSGQIAFADGRTPASGGFGQLCAFLSVSDLDLNTCLTVAGNEVVQPVNTIFNGPLLPDIEFYDTPQGVNLMGSSRTWQEGNACNTVPCVADFTFQFPDCNPTVSFTNMSTGPAPLSYFWHFGYSTGGIPHTSTAVNPIITYPAQCSTYNVCLTVNGNGCTNTICKNVVIKYPQQPVLTCPPNITVACNTNLTPAITGFATLTGACSGQNPNITFSDNTSGMMPCNGTVLRTWTAVDECGVTRTCVQTITVQDNVPPIAMCAPGQGYELNEDCELPITVDLINAGSTDNCQIQSMSVSPAVVQGCGIFPITLTVTDLCGNTSTCATEIQTIEGVPPMIECPPNINLTCGDDISPAATGMATATDLCDPNPVITFADVVTGTLPCNALITRTWTATDNCGNEATCVQNIVVIDNVPPMISCPPDQTVNTNPGQCFYTGLLQEPTATDNCNPTPAITCYLVTAAGLVLITPGMEFPKGTHSICCVADDGCVDVSELICTYPCTAGGDIQEPDSPLGFAQNSILNSPNQLLLTALGIQQGVSGNILVKDVLVGGNCFDITNVTTQGQASQLSVFTNGQTNIGFEAGVILTTGPGTLAVGPNNSDNAGGGVGGVTPDADLATLTTSTLYDRASLEFDFIPTQSIVTFRFAYASEEYCEKVGNPIHDVFGFFISGPGISGGQQNIALIPTTTTPVNINTVNHLINSGFYTNNQPASSANLCGQTPSSAAATTEVQYDGFTRAFTAIANVQPGQTYHLKLAIADAGDDLYDSAVFLDAGSFDAGGNAAVEWVVNSNPVSTVAYENCGTVNLVFDRVGGNINVPQTVSYIISGSATAGLDYVPFASSIIIPAGQAQFSLPVTILNDAILEGDETIVVTLNDVCSFLMPQKTLILKDKALLQAKCTFTLTVEDHELPVIMCPPNITVSGTLNGQGVCSAVVGNLAPTVSDNCPMLMVDYVITGATTGTGVNDASGTTFLAGTSIVTYTATDMSGNMVTCQTQVTVTCPPPPPCTVSFAVNFIDNCGHVQLVSTSTGQQPISYQWSTSESTPDIDLMLPCGQHTFSVSITCADGSMSSATQTINITDNVPPTIICPQDVQLSCFSATTPATTGFATATDNCSILSLTYTDVVTGTQPCNQVITRTWRAEDWCNNVSTCVQTITIMDNIPPVLTGCPQNITVAGVLDLNGDCTANVQVISPVATDLCDQAVSLVNSFNNTADASGTYPNGTTTVTWTATDHCGNTATCSFNVTVDCSMDICCPEFSLVQLDSITPCPGDFSCRGDSVAFHSPVGSGGGKKTACKNSAHTYYIVPNLPGFTFSWTVVGGTPASFTGNPGVITWGSNSEGSIEVIITDANGNCRDTITQEFCLLDSPTAGFTVAPIPGTIICTNQLVTFTNTSVGANTHHWDFGDNTSSTAVNPSHSYASPGIYTVLLTVSNGLTNSVDSLCGCIDTATAIITVIAGTGPEITPDCKEMVCPGDIVKYCTPLGCLSYNWTVNGGTITINNGNCITVQWDATAPPTLPAFVSVTTGCTTGPCGNSATLNVPVLWGGMPISGPTPVCIGTTETYSLPTMPGTFYTWTVSGGGGTIVGPSKNTPSITVKWNGPVGSATIACTYDNPYSGCMGSSTKTVDVRPEFEVFGPANTCANDPNPSFFSSNGLANWTISPANGGYTFVGATTNTSIIGVNWTIPGSYTITATPNPGIFCNSSEVVNIVVNPAPIITLNGPLIVCRGQLYDYTATSTLPGNNISWSFTGSGTGTIAPYGPDNSNASVIFTGPGPWMLMASQTVNGCRGSATITITNDLVPILNPTSLTACIGGTVMVSVQPGSGPGPYIWSTSPEVSFMGENPSGTATYEVHGDGMIQVSNCSGPSNFVNVTKATPTSINITQTGSLCTNDLVLSTTTSGTLYQWFGGGTQISPSTLAVTNPGIYTVQVEFLDGCISVATYTVMPEVVPTVSISTPNKLRWCLTETVMVNLHAFAQSQSIGCTYQWYDANGLIPNATGASHLATTAGSYFVEVTCGGCIAYSNKIVVIQDICPPGSGCLTYPIPPNPFPLSAITVSSGCNPKTFSVNVTGCSGGIVTWNFGDGNTATGNTVTHAYTSHGAFPVTAQIACNGCSFQVDTTVNVPVLADFNYSVTCGANGSYTVTFNNTSQTLGGWVFNPVTDVIWTSNCATPLSGSGNSFTLNTSPYCNPTVTMDITVNDPVSGDICMDSKTITLSLPTQPLSISGPSTVCKNQLYTFNYSWNGPTLVLYEWTEIINSIPVPVSQESLLNYAFSATGTYDIGLTVTDVFGCTYTAMHTVMVDMPGALTIAPVKICPDCLPPASLNATPVGGFTNYQWYQNGIPVGTNSATHPLCQFNASGNYYVTAEDSQHNNCTATSNTVQVVYEQKPNANIQGQSTQCVPGNGPYLVPLQNAGVNNSTYTYNWTAAGPGSITFTPNNSQANVNATVTALGTYQFILTVTDMATGCMAKDTFCVYFCAEPVVTVSGPGGSLCAGMPHTFTASATPPGNYVYVWSNGATGPVMTTSQAGLHTVTATDTDCGCTDDAFAGFINQTPSPILFPVGCDTICDTDSIVPPLALGGNWPINASGYSVQWFLVGNPIPFFTGPGSVLNLGGNVPPPLGYGFNDIYIVVTYNGCSDTSNVYNLFIKECCICKSDLTISHSGVEYPVFCNPHTGFIPSLPCPADDVIVSGFMGFVNQTTDEPCAETTVIWELLHPDGHTQGGLTTNFTSFIFPKDSVDEPGLYCLTLTTISPDGLDTCFCKVTWVREPCVCCTTLEDFCDRLENNISLSVDNILCKATLNIGNFNGCDDYIEWVDWNYPSQQQQGPFLSGSMPMHTYPGSGTYTVCYLAIERDSTGLICFEKLVCETITIDCADCYCGTFSGLFFPLNRIILGTPTICDAPEEITIPCPSPGNSIQFTGLFQCAGPNCPATAQVTWELIRLPNTSVKSGTTTANPYFGINILPAWYAIPGSYELRLVGHCGQQECPCIVRFKVDCPDPCPCNVDALDAAVDQGFAIVKYPTSCKACFVPVALSDCETVEWHLNTANGPLIGTSVGNNAICHTFPGSGTYTVVMIVTRRRSDGSICGVFTKSQTVTLTCLILSDCTDSNFPNPGFSEGAVGGGLLSGGMSAGWGAASGNPAVVEGAPGSSDAWTIQLSGNFDSSAVLTTLDPICVEKTTGMLSLRMAAKRPPYDEGRRQRPCDVVKVSGSGWSPSVPASGRLAFIPLDVLDPVDWVEVEIPYDLTNRMDFDTCSVPNNGVWIQLSVEVTNALVSSQGGEDTHSYAQVDKVCFNGTVVTATNDPRQQASFRLYPNPNSGAFTLELPQAATSGMHFRILSLTGQILMKKIAEAGSARQKLEVEALPAGLYFLQVVEEGRVVGMERFVKQ